MCTAEVRSLGRMGRPTMNGNAVTKRAVHPIRVRILLGLALVCAGCSGMSPPSGTGAPESPNQAASPIRDRGPELTALRAEMAATLIAAAKKEAELRELRDLVRQLRMEVAESRQAFLDLRDRAEQHQTEVEKGRDEQDRQAQSQTTQRLAVLNDTVVTLAQELDRLKQELVRQAVEERSLPSGTILSKSDRPSSLDSRTDPPDRGRATRQTSALSSTNSPVALTVTSAVVTGSPPTITVQPGDTLASLAKRHRTTVEVLRKLNLLKGDALIVGRELVLPTF